MSAQRSVLFDAQGPRAQRITLGFNVLGLVLVAGICWSVARVASRVEGGRVPDRERADA